MRFLYPLSPPLQHLPISSVPFSSLTFTATFALLTYWATLRRLWQFTRDDRLESDIMMHPNTRRTVIDWWR